MSRLSVGSNTLQLPGGSLQTDCPLRKRIHRELIFSTQSKLTLYGPSLGRGWVGVARLRLYSGPPAVVLWAVAALATLHAAVDARGARAVVILRMPRVTHCHVRHVPALLEHGLRLPDLVQLLDGVHDLRVEGLRQ